MKAGPERDALCARLLPLVDRIARSLWSTLRCGEVSDFIQDGCIGMVRAVSAYDPERGVPIEAFARVYISGAILNGVRSRDPISENARKLIRQAESTRYAMAQERREVPTMREMAAQIAGLGGALVVAYRSQVLSLDEELPDGDEGPLDHDADPAAIAERRERIAQIRAALEALSERQREVIRRHYLQGQTVQSVGEQMNISPQRVSQLRQTALDNMRKTLAATA